MDRILEKLKQIKIKYQNTRDRGHLKEANWDLAKLCNLRDAFDTTFDYFFDDKELRLKYNAWNHEQDRPNYDVSNADLEKMLDITDLNAYILFIEYQTRLLNER